MPTAIRMLGEVALRVNDLDSMVDFYHSVIGLTLMRKEESFAFFRIAEGFAGHTQVLALFDRRAGSSGDSTYVAPESIRTTIDHIAFTIDKADFESEDQRLRQLGLATEYAYHDWVQWRSLYVRDPEGNTVELVCFDPVAEQSS